MTAVSAATYPLAPLLCAALGHRWDARYRCATCARLYCEVVEDAGREVVWRNQRQRNGRRR